MFAPSAFRIGVATIVGVACAGSSLSAQSEKPDLNPLQVTGEVVAGTAAGYVGYFAGRFVGTHVASLAFGSGSHETARRNVKLGFGYASGLVATAGAVYGVGQMRDQDGEFATTVLGSGVGFGVSVILTRLVWPPGRPPETGRNQMAMRAAEFIEVMLPSIGATIAFNSTRKARLRE